MKDWTANEDGRSNSSGLYFYIVGQVENLLNESRALRPNELARLIVSQLAHKHRLSPLAVPVILPTAMQFERIPMQPERILVALCPNCNGAKTVSRLPNIAGDVIQWEQSSSGPWPCPTCEANGYIKLKV